MHHDCPSMLCLELSAPLPKPVIALGSELKNTVCIGQGSTLLVSPVHPDLGSSRDLHRFHETLDDFVELLGESASDIIWAHDLHPAFTGTRYVRQRSFSGVGVQHHYAHALSCVADTGLDLPVIAVVGDGMGYGADGTVWGGEVLICHEGSYERAAHLRRFKLPGGDLAARQPWRMALSLWLESASAHEMLTEPELEGVAHRDVDLVSRQWAADFNAPLCSSLGRLFDGVAWLSGLGNGNSSEGLAARALETAAYGTRADPLSFSVDGESGVIELDWRPMIVDLVSRRRAGAGSQAIAAAFHAALIEMFCQAVVELGRRQQIRQVVLSGGCFFNEILREGLSERLREFGMQVANHRMVSTGDAGLSVGQAVAAAYACGGR